MRVVYLGSGSEEGRGSETEEQKPIQGCITDLKATVGNSCLILLETSDEPFEKCLRLLPRTGVSELWSLEQIWLATYFCRNFIGTKPHHLPE